jgi:hypothetical protein
MTGKKGESGTIDVKASWQGTRNGVQPRRPSPCGLGLPIVPRAWDLARRAIVKKDYHDSSTWPARPHGLALPPAGNRRLQP